MKAETTIAVIAILCIALLIGWVLIRLNHYDKKEKHLEKKREKYTFPNANTNKK